MSVYVPSVNFTSADALAVIVATLLLSTVTEQVAELIETTGEPHVSDTYPADTVGVILKNSTLETSPGYAVTVISKV